MKTDRAAWTEHVTGKKQPKYRSERQGRYSSKHEERIARDLWVLADGGRIFDLREQVRFELVKGRNGVRGVTYVADFTYQDEGGNAHVCDAKGMKTQVYQIKKRMMYLLCGITIEEL